VALVPSAEDGVEAAEERAEKGGSAAAAPEEAPEEADSAVRAEWEEAALPGEDSAEDADDDTHLPSSYPSP